MDKDLIEQILKDYSKMAQNETTESRLDRMLFGEGGARILILAPPFGVALPEPCWSHFGPWEPRKQRKIRGSSAWGALKPRKIRGVCPSELRKPRKIRGFRAWEPLKPRKLRGSCPWKLRKHVTYEALAPGSFETPETT